VERPGRDTGKPADLTYMEALLRTQQQQCKYLPAVCTEENLHELG
jgi:hypothetical protein